MFMVSRRIRDGQNYLLLENVSHLTGEDDLERLALKFTDQLAQLEGKDPYAIIQLFSHAGEKLKRREREHVAYICMSCAMQDAETQLVGISGDICRELRIKQRVISSMSNQALEDSGPNMVMGYSPEHKAVKSILDEALARTTPPPAP